MPNIGQILSPSDHTAFESKANQQCQSKSRIGTANQVWRHASKWIRTWWCWCWLRLNGRNWRENFSGVVHREKVCFETLEVHYYFFFVGEKHRIGIRLTVEHSGGAWIAEWYRIQLWSLVHCAMPWATSLTLGDDNFYFGPIAQHLHFLHDSIWFIWFETIICLSNLSCELWNRKLKIK